MAHLGNVIEKDDRYFAKIETREAGARFYMEGPLRTDQDEAREDLQYIRSCAEGSANRTDGLHCMKQAAKELREQAKAAAKAQTQVTNHGSITVEGAERYTARIHYREDGKEREIVAPCRKSSERRATNDLAALREAAQGAAGRADGFAAMRAKCRELHEAADMENRVAYGSAQYETVRNAHKTEDSDPDDAGEAAEVRGEEQTSRDDADDWLYDIDFSDPAVIQKLFPPPAPAPRPPPQGVDEATQQLIRFLPNRETPATLRAILAARADPNVNICEGDPLPLLPELVSALLDARIDPNRFVRKTSMSPLMVVISRARPEHLEAMRDTLVEYGAEYGVEERRRYQGRYDSDQYDPIYVREFYRSAAFYAARLAPCCL